jgi:formylglycine-generating enzyme required for sulfatase activity
VELDPKIQCLATAESLEAVDARGRREAIGALVARLGPDWSVGSSEGDVGNVLLHGPSAHRFVVVPGGPMLMGLRDADVAAVSRLVEWTSEMENSLYYDGETAKPVHSVVVATFLCSERLLAGGSRSEAIATAARLGFRLPSEVELEWLARDGGGSALTLDARPVPGKPGAFTFGSSRFGVRDLLWAQWAADDWHDTYEGAPSNSQPWMEGGADGVCRNTAAIDSMVSESDIAVLFAALRTRGSPAMPCATRLVREIALFG